MLPILLKTLGLLAAIGIGCAIGYFGSAAYFENNPKTLSQAKEMDGHENTIGWENKDVLLAVNPAESWRIWQHKELAFMELTAKKEPKSKLFQELKKELANRVDNKSDKLRVTCWSAYKSTIATKDKENIEVDMKAYCSI